MKSTIKDVSKTSGISVVTISKYLNGYSVRKSSKEKIDIAIKELNYTVNQNARSLKTNKSMLIGIIIDTIVNTFYATLVSLMEMKLRENNYSSIIYETKDDPSLMESGLNFLYEKGVDGILLFTTCSEHEVLNKFLQKFNKVVVIDSILSDINCDCVATDNITGTYYAIEQFILKGHKNIAIITGKSNHFSAQERLRGYQRALEDYGININNKMIFKEAYDIMGGYNAFNKLYSNNYEKPTAVFIASYFMTIGSIIYINEKNINVPDDISIICFDNHELNMVFKPRLTYIEQPIEEISKIGVDLLFKRINNTSTDNRIIRVSPKLVFGNSVSNLI